MKSQQQNFRLCLFFILFLFFTAELRASHISGGELTYTHIQGNQYQVEATFYRDCFGIAAPGGIILNISSQQCAIALVETLLTVPGTGLEITQSCLSAQTSCQGGQ